MNENKQKLVEGSKHINEKVKHPRDVNHQVHEHGGKSSRDILDPIEILKKAGLEAGMYFLDAGCGDGFISIEASKTASQVYAVDIYLAGLEELMLAVSEQDLKNIHVIHSDIAKGVPIEEGKIDLCLMSNVFHGIVANGELEDVVPRLLCTLNKNGRLAIVEFRKVKSPGPPMDVRLSPGDMKKILEPHGFQVERIVDVGKWHYMMVLSR